MKTLYVVDAVAFLFRSYFAIKGMTNSKGESSGALYGFIRTLQKLIKEKDPSHLICVFDGPNNKASRTKIYPDYKGHRESMPEDLVPQLFLAHEFCRAVGIPLLSIEGVEADDTMGSIAKWAESQGTEVILCSADKDLAQLVTKKTKMLNVHKDNLLLDEKGVFEQFEVRPDQIIDYLAIMGDSADNIPGIPGLGKKAASSLLSVFNSLEELYDRVEEVKSEKQKAKIVENKESAFISKKLATIDLSVPFEKSDDYFAIKDPKQEDLVSLYREQNFLTLLKEVEQTPSDKKEIVDYQLVNSEEEVLALLDQLKKETEVCIDTETTGLELLSARVVGVGFSFKEKTSFYVPSTFLHLLKPYLEGNESKFYGHNLKFDLHMLLNESISVKNICFDTIIASYLLSSHQSRHSLDQITLEKFGKVLTPIEEIIGKGKKQISMMDAPIEKVSHYCGEDVDYTLRLKHTFEKSLEKENLDHLFYDVEMPLLPVLLKMERNGIYLDTKQLAEKSKELNLKINSLEKIIHEIVGEPFNIKSPKQLSEALFDKLEIPIVGKKKSTNAAVLEKLKADYPIAKHVLEYRTYEKLRSTYVDALPKQVDSKTNLIHCSYNQTGTATGRLSCNNPNLQNIPVKSVEGRKIREAFLPRDKNASFISCDYSQIELRLLAHFSEDPLLLEAFNSGKDIHTSCASEVFSVPEEDVTKVMRNQAKIVNFGIIYGQGAYGLSEELGIGIKEAKAFIKKYFEKYQRVKEYLEECVHSARDLGYAKTLLLRKRKLPEITSKNGILRSQSERLAVNTPLQGSQADIIKLAMIEIDKKLDQIPSAKMILQIHDELIFECDDHEIEKVTTLAKNEMEAIVSLKVPLTVDISIGKNWGEC